MCYQRTFFPPGESLHLAGKEKTIKGSDVIFSILETDNYYVEKKD